jgi:predicted  nucleic acid-binding Zn-ribbon protein
MKPQSLQDAIKSAAMKKKTKIQSGGWKEPKVKQVKVTAADMKSSERARGSSKGMAFMPPAPPVDNVMRKELDLLKKQMIDLKSSMSTGAPAASSSSQTSAKSASNEEVEELRDEVRELRLIVEDLVDLPNEVSRLRDMIRDVKAQQADVPSGGGDGGVAPDDFDDLKHEVQSLRAAMRKQKGELVRELNEALSQLGQHQSAMKAQKREIDTMKREVKAANLKADQAEKQSKKAALTTSSVPSSVSAPTPRAPSPEISRKHIDDSSESSEELPVSSGRNHLRGRGTFQQRATESFQNSFRAKENDDDDDDYDEGNGDIEIEIDEPEEEEEEEDGHQKFSRRGSLDSVQTMDTSPRKKTISLLPHKSIDIYTEQRKDTILRKLMLKAKTPNMAVRKVHGKNLVFFSDRVYVPASLRKKTIEFYYKKYKKQTPIIHLEKNCFWADMKSEYKLYEGEKKGTLKTIGVKAPAFVIS